jgi:hypothetical protein
VFGRSTQVSLVAAEEEAVSYVLLAPEKLANQEALDVFHSTKSSSLCP